MFFPVGEQAQDFVPAFIAEFLLGMVGALIGSYAFSAILINVLRPYLARERNSWIEGRNPTTDTDSAETTGE
jgi:hypothetical protein